MRREVKVRGYAPITSDQVMRFAAALGADRKPWVQAYAFAVGTARRGDSLNPLEAKWLETWLEGKEREPRDVIAVQVGIEELSRLVFDGNRRTAQRAIRHLTDIGLMEVIQRGKPGHSTLYALGFIEWARDTKHCENVSEHDDESIRGRDTVSDDVGYKNEPVGYKNKETGYKQVSLTCENGENVSVSLSASIFEPSSYPSNNQEAKRRGKSQEGDFHALRCAHCGSTDLMLNAFRLHECRKCGQVTRFRAVG